MHFFTVVERDKTLALEAMNHLGNRRRREAQELRQSRRDDAAVLVGERVDGLQILLDGRRSGDC
jgi:hypothetical protein